MISPEKDKGNRVDTKIFGKARSLCILFYYFSIIKNPVKTKVLAIDELGLAE
jgi:hypothetical protein